MGDGDKNKDQTEEKDEKNLSNSEKTDAEYTKIKASNDKLETEMRRTEELEARSAVGGKTTAGQEEKPKTEDEKWEEDAKKRYEGTGLDPTEDNTPTVYA